MIFAVWIWSLWHAFASLYPTRSWKQEFETKMLITWVCLVGDSYPRFGS